MHPRVYREFELICAKRKAGGKVLEIGAMPNDNTLLNMRCLGTAAEKVGVNLAGPSSYKDFEIIQANANNMSCFSDNKFDTILCNATLEHDKFFWKTISEIKRVAKPGGLIVICSPGFIQYPFTKVVRLLFSKVATIDRSLSFFTRSTVTFNVHNFPGDYYRFSVQAFKEVLFEGMRDIEVRPIMVPPRIIGSAIKP